MALFSGEEFGLLGAWFRWLPSADDFPVGRSLPVIAQRPRWVPHAFPLCLQSPVAGILADLKNSTRCFTVV